MTTLKRHHAAGMPPEAYDQVLSRPLLSRRWALTASSLTMASLTAMASPLLKSGIRKLNTTSGSNANVKPLLPLGTPSRSSGRFAPAARNSRGWPWGRRAQRRLSALNGVDHKDAPITNAQAASRAARRPRRVELIPPGDVSAMKRTRSIRPSAAIR